MSISSLTCKHNLNFRLFERDMNFLWIRSWFRPDTVCAYRMQSTLAEKMEQAVSGININDSEEDQKRMLTEQRDSKVIFF